MKNKKLISLGFVLALIVSSCNKDNAIKTAIETNPENPSIIFSQYYDASVNIGLFQIGNTLKSANVHGNFKDNNTFINVGNLTVDGEIVTNTNNCYESLNNNTAVYNIPVTKVFSFFNKKIQLKFDGNVEKGYTALNEEIEMPKILNITTPLTEDFFKIKRGKGISLSWEVDGGENIYMGYTLSSVGMDDDKTHTAVISDNGNLNISYSVLEKFKGQIISFVLYRYSANEFEVGSKKMNFYTRNTCNVGTFKFETSN